MSPKWVAGFTFLYVSCTLVCLIMGASYYGSTEAQIMNDLLTFRIQNVLGFIPIPVFVVDFFVYGIPRLVFWDYSFLTGGYALVKWLILYPLSAGFMWGIIQTLIQLVSRVI